MRNMHPESTVTRLLLRAAPRQAAGLAVGLQDTCLLPPVPLAATAGTPALLLSKEQTLGEV